MRDLSLSDFKSRQGGRLSGGMLLTTCPFHEDSTPSLGVYETPERHYHCFGCKAHGSWRELWEVLGSPGTVVLAPPDRSDSWYDRPRWGGDTPLAQYAERSHLALVSQPHLHWYIQDRGIEEAIEPASLGWDTGWLTVPVTDDGGEVVGIVGRAYPHIAYKVSMRYDMPRKQPPLAYVPDWRLWNEAEIVFILFGVIDAISMVVAGLAAASPTAGKGSFDPRWLDRTDKSVVVIPDRHEDRDAFELARSLDWRGRVYIPEYENKEKDVNDILVQRGPEGLRYAVAADKRNSSRSRS